MIKIRKGMFETNSSSMHRLVVMKEAKAAKGYSEYYDYHLIDDHKFVIYSTEDLTFDRWPFDILCTLGAKIRYAIASLCTFKEKDECKRIVKNLIEHLKKRDPRIDEIELPYDDDDDPNSEELYYGEVDHESYGMLEAF